MEKVKNGEWSIDEAEAYFRREPFEDLGYAKIDSHRKIRSGVAEVVFCSGKADEHLLQLFKRIYEEEGQVLGTRASLQQAELIKTILPEAVYDSLSRILKVEKSDKQRQGLVAVCTAGTADIPVAEEAAQTAEFLGSNVIRIFDVGVSGLHRLLARLDQIQDANCIVAVAGISRVKKAGIDACDFNVILEHENHDHDMEYLHGHKHVHDHHHEHEHHHHFPFNLFHHHHHHEHRGLEEIKNILVSSSMTDHAKAIAVRIFEIIADAEAKAHGLPRNEVHFHEVGAVDSIVDIAALSTKLNKPFLEQWKEITEHTKQIGLDYVTLDLEGFRSGSMDSLCFVERA